MKTIQELNEKLQEKGVTAKKLAEYLSTWPQPVNLSAIALDGAEPPLHVAIKIGNTKLVQLLLEKYGADVHEVYEYQRDGKYGGTEYSCATRLSALGLAVEEGRLGIAKLLVKHGADVSQKGVKPAICIAAEKGKKLIVNWLLENGVYVSEHYNEVRVYEGDIKAPTRFATWSMTPLNFALQNSCNGIAKTLLKKGAYTHALEVRPALLFAVLQKTTEMLQILLESGSDPNVASKNAPGLDRGVSALGIACQAGKVDAVKLLLQYGATIGANIDAKRLYKGKTALHWAAQANANAGEVIDELFKQPGAKDLLDKKDADGRTPLDIALTIGNQEAVVRLKHHASAADVLDDFVIVEDDETPASSRSTGTRPKPGVGGSGDLSDSFVMVEPEVTQAPEVTLPNPQSTSTRSTLGRQPQPLPPAPPPVAGVGAFDDLLASTILHTSSAQSSDVQPYEVGVEGSDPFITSTIFSTSPPVQPHGPTNLNIYEDFHNALSSAELTTALNLMAQEEFDVQHTDANQQTPLHWAAEAGRIDVVRALLKAGAAIDAADNQWQRPLSIAVSFNDLDMVNLLVDEGANVNFVIGQVVTHRKPRTEAQHAELSAALWRGTEKGELQRAVIAGKFESIYELVKKCRQKAIKQALFSLLAADSGLQEDNTEQQYAFKGLLDALEDKATVDEQGNTLLHAAIMGKHPGIAPYIIYGGVTVNHPDKSGELPIALALKAGYEDVAIALIDAGSELSGLTTIDEDRQHKQVSLYEVAANAKPAPLQRVLDKMRECGINDTPRMGREVEHGASEDLLYYMGSSPIDRDAVIAMLNLGADVNCYTQNLEVVQPKAKTPLYYAVEAGDFEAVRLLLNRGATLEVRDNNGKVMVSSQDLLDLINVNSQKWMSVNDSQKRQQRDKIEEFLKRRATSTSEKLTAPSASSNPASRLGSASIGVGSSPSLDALLSGGGSMPSGSGSGLPSGSTAPSGGPSAPPGPVSPGGTVEDAPPRDLNVVKDLTRQLNESIKACRPGQPLPLARIKELVEQGADPNALDSFGNTALHSAFNLRSALSDDETKILVQCLIEQCGAHVDSRSEIEMTALHRAMERDMPLTVHYLIAQGADCQAVDDQGYNILHFATSGGNLALMQLAVDNGIRVNQVNVPRQTPLHIAVTNNQAGAAEWLLAHGANVNALANENTTPLHCLRAAIMKCDRYDMRIVGSLLAAPGVQINALNRYNHTPLDVVLETPLWFGSSVTQDQQRIKAALAVRLRASGGQTYRELEAASVASAALSATGSTAASADTVPASRAAPGVEPRRPRSTGIYTTPTGRLNYLIRGCSAAQAAPIEQIEDLIANGIVTDSGTVKADPNELDRNGNTALHNVFKTSAANIPDDQALELVTVLLRNGARVDELNRSGATALHLALDSNLPKTAQYLIEHGANRSAIDNENNNVLHHAASGGSLALIDMAILQGHGVNTPNELGYTPLHNAAMAGRSDAVQWLLASGANVNTKTQDQDTPLHLALSMAMLQDGYDARVIDHLLEMPGIQLDALDGHGRTPMEVLQEAEVAIGNGNRDRIRRQLKSDLIMKLEDKLHPGASSETRLAVPGMAPAEPLPEGARMVAASPEYAPGRTTVQQYDPEEARSKAIAAMVLLAAVSGGVGYSVMTYYFGPALLQPLVSQGIISQTATNWSQVGVAGGAALPFAVIALALLWSQHKEPNQAAGTEAEVAETEQGKGLTGRQVGLINLAATPLFCATAMMASMLVGTAIKEAMWANVANIVINVGLPALLAGVLSALLVGGEDKSK